MIQDLGQQIFNNEYKDVQISKLDQVLVFRGHSKKDDEILVRDGTTEIEFPDYSQFADAGNEAGKQEKFRYLFSIDEQRYFIYENWEEHMGDSEEKIPAGYTFSPIRTLRKNIPRDASFAGVTGYHLFTWYRENRFCGHCGSRTIHAKNLRAKVCEACGNMMFPKIAPAVIVGLIHEDSILISRYAGREYKGRALLAGFCEIGETPEETVRREVYEEVGLKVKDISYFASQPWGFDSNLLLGYFANVDGDIAITMDEEELASATFVKREDIEEDSNLMSLTATMIEHFRRGI